MKHYTRLSQIQVDLKSGQLELPSLVGHYLSVIDDRKDLNIFLEVFAQEAKEHAARIQEKIKNGTAGKLAGAVISIKDNLAYKGHKMSASSKILEGFESIYTCTALQRLLDEDALVIGRTNCDEFAMGSSTENSAFGPSLNPIDPSLVSGGSSGGSAASVSGGMCLASLGSETGGSVRQPASFCGVVGVKPTYGAVSRYGLIAYASSFDQISPFAHCVEDAAIILQTMAGKDEMDSTSSSEDIGDIVPSLPTDKKYRISYIKNCVEREGVQPEVKAAMEQSLEKLKAMGHEVKEVEFPYLDHMIPTYYVLTTAEASSNLARFDGIHYGYRSEEATDIETTYVKSRSEGFGTEVKRRIMLGTFVLSAGYYDAYYAKAMKVRRLVKEATDALFEDADLIMLPTAPSSAFKVGAVQDPIAMYLQDIFTVQANLAGVPAVSIPLFKDQNERPFGLQFMAPRFAEAHMMDIAAQMEDAHVEY